MKPNTFFLTVLAASLALSAAAYAVDLPAPEPEAPVGAVVVLHCGKIAAVAVSDSHGALYPVDVARTGEATLRKILTHIPNQLVATISCHAEADDQRSTTL